MENFTIESKILSTEKEIVDLGEEKIDVENTLKLLYEEDLKLDLNPDRKDREIILLKRISVKSRITENLYLQFLNIERIEKAK